MLITGATSGLGREMAIQLARRGCRVAITGRRRDRLDEAASAARQAGASDVIALHGSVTDDAAVRAHAQAIRDAWGGVDVVILNAGVGDSVHGTAFSAENYRWTFDTNVLGACRWIEQVLPDMLARGSGVIAGISSPAGWRGFPGAGSYSASKAALTTLLESLRVDLRGSGVDVVTVCPGFIRSEITDRNDPKEMIQLLDTADGARRILRGIEQRRRVVHFPFPLTWIIRYVIRPMPGWLYDRLASRYLRRTKKPYVDASALTPPPGDRAA